MPTVNVILTEVFDQTPEYPDLVEMPLSIFLSNDFPFATLEVTAKILQLLADSALLDTVSVDLSKVAYHLTLLISPWPLPHSASSDLHFIRINYFIWPFIIRK